MYKQEPEQSLDERFYQLKKLSNNGKFLAITAAVR